MTEHYSKSTVGVTMWCNTCRRMTNHAVSGKKVGRCTEHEAAGLSKQQERNRQQREEQERNPRMF